MKRKQIMATVMMSAMLTGGAAAGAYATAAMSTAAEASQSIESYTPIIHYNHVKSKDAKVGTVLATFSMPEGAPQDVTYEMVEDDGEGGWNERPMKYLEIDGNQLKIKQLDSPASPEEVVDCPDGGKCMAPAEVSLLSVAVAAVKDGKKSKLARNYEVVDGDMTNYTYLVEPNDSTPSEGDGEEHGGSSAASSDITQMKPIITPVADLNEKNAVDGALIATLSMPEGAPSSVTYKLDTSDPALLGIYDFIEIVGNEVRLKENLDAVKSNFEPLLEKSTSQERYHDNKRHAKEDAAFAFKIIAEADGKQSQSAANFEEGYTNIQATVKHYVPPATENPNSFNITNMYYYIGPAKTRAEVPEDKWVKLSAEDIAKINSSNGEASYLGDHPIDITLVTPLNLKTVKGSRIFLKVDADKEGVVPYGFDDLMQRGAKDERGTSIIFNSVAFLKSGGGQSFWRPMNIHVETSDSNIDGETPVLNLNRIVTNKAVAGKEIATLSMPSSFNGDQAQVEYRISGSLKSPYKNVVRIEGNKVYLVDDLYETLHDDYGSMPETDALIDKSDFTKANAHLKAGARLPLAFKAFYGDKLSHEVTGELVIGEDDGTGASTLSDYTPIITPVADLNEKTAADGALLATLTMPEGAPSPVTYKLDTSDPNLLDIYKFIEIVGNEVRLKENLGAVKSDFEPLMAADESEKRFNDNKRHAKEGKQFAFKIIAEADGNQSKSAANFEEGYTNIQATVKHYVPPAAENPNSFSIKKLFYYIGKAKSAEAVPADQWVEVPVAEVAKINTSNGEGNYLGEHNIDVNVSTDKELKEVKKSNIFLKVEADKDGVERNSFNNLMERSVKDTEGNTLVFNRLAYLKSGGGATFWRPFNLRIETFSSNIAELAPVVSVQNVPTNQARAGKVIATIAMPENFNGNRDHVEFRLSGALQSPYRNIMRVEGNKVYLVDDLYSVLHIDYANLPETKILIDGEHFTEADASLKAGATLPIKIKAFFGDGESREGAANLVIGADDGTGTEVTPPEEPGGNDNNENPGSGSEEQPSTDSKTIAEANEDAKITVAPLGETLPENVVSKLNKVQKKAYEEALNVGSDLYRIFDVTATVEKDMYKFRLPLEKKLLDNKKTVKKVVHLTKNGQVEEFAENLVVQYDKDGAPFVLLQAKTLSPFIAIYGDAAHTGSGSSDSLIPPYIGRVGSTTDGNNSTEVATSENRGNEPDADEDAVNKAEDKTVETALAKEEDGENKAASKKTLANKGSGQGAGSVAPAKGTMVQTGDQTDLGKTAVMGVLGLFALMLGGFMTVLKKIKS